MEILHQTMFLTVEKVDTLFNEYIAMCNNEIDYKKVMLMTIESVNYYNQIRIDYLDSLNDLKEFLKTVIIKGQENNEIRNELNPDEIIENFMVIIIGIEHMWFDNKELTNYVDNSFKYFWQSIKN